MKLARKVAAFLGLRQSILVILGMVVLVSMGEKMAGDFLPVYIKALGGSSKAIGTLSLLSVLLGALYAFPGGYLSDRWGHKKALLAFNLFAMTGYVIVIAFPCWQAVLLGSGFFLSWTAVSLPATMTMVGRVLPPSKRTMGVTVQSLVRRIPMALGPILGGWLIATYGMLAGVRLAFAAALVLCLVSLVMQQRLIVEDIVRERAERNPLRLLFHLVRRMSPELRNLLVSDILVRFCEQIPNAFVVIWCLEYAHTTSVQFGFLRAVEMATAVLIYVPVAYLADKSTKKPFVVITFVFFSLFPLALLYANSLPALLPVFVLRGLKEFGEPTRKVLILDLASKEETQRAGMFGLYYLIRDGIVALAAFGGALLWEISPATNLLAASSFGALGTLYFILFGRDLGARRAGHGAAA